MSLCHTPGVQVCFALMFSSPKLETSKKKREKKLAVLLHYQYSHISEFYLLMTVFKFFFYIYKKKPDLIMNFFKKMEQQRTPDYHRILQKMEVRMLTLEVSQNISIINESKIFTLTIKYQSNCFGFWLYTVTIRIKSNMYMITLMKKIRKHRHSSCSGSSIQLTHNISFLFSQSGISSTLLYSKL